MLALAFARPSHPTEALPNQEHDDAHDDDDDDDDGDDDGHDHDDQRRTSRASLGMADLL